MLSPREVTSEDDQLVVFPPLDRILDGEASIEPILGILHHEHCL